MKNKKTKVFAFKIKILSLRLKLFVILIYIYFFVRCFVGFEFFTAAKQASKQSKQAAAAAVVVKIFILMPQQINQSNMRYNLYIINNHVSKRHRLFTTKQQQPKEIAS